MKPWEHLLESDSREQQLRRQWSENGDRQTLFALLQMMWRRGDKNVQATGASVADLVAWGSSQSGQVIRDEGDLAEGGIRRFISARPNSIGYRIRLGRPSRTNCRRRAQGNLPIPRYRVYIPIFSTQYSPTGFDRRSQRLGSIILHLGYDARRIAVVNAGRYGRNMATPAEQTMIILLAANLSTLLPGWTLQNNY